MKLIKQKKQKIIENVYKDSKQKETTYILGRLLELFYKEFSKFEPVN